MAAQASPVSPFVRLDPALDSPTRKFDFTANVLDQTKYTTKHSKSLDVQNAKDHPTPQLLDTHAGLMTNQTLGLSILFNLES